MSLQLTNSMLERAHSVAERYRHQGNWDISNMRGVLRSCLAQGAGLGDICEIAAVIAEPEWLQEQSMLELAMSVPSFPGRVPPPLPSLPPSVGLMWNGPFGAA